MRNVLIAAACLALLCGVSLSQDVKPAAPAAPAADADKFGLDASKVTLKVKDAALDDVLHALAKQSGNACLDLPADWEARGVALDVADLSYWQALDKLCAQFKLCYTLETAGQYPTQKTQVTLRDAGDGENRACYCGPVVVKLANVTAARRYLPPSPGAERGGLELSLAWFCEDRLHALDAKAEVTKLTGADGKELALDSQASDAAPPQARGPFANPHAIMIARLGGYAPVCTTAGTVVAKVDSPPRDLRTLKSVEGVVKITFGQGAKELKVEDVFGGKNNSAEADKDKLSVAQANRQNNWANVVLQYTVEGKDVEVPAAMEGSPYGVKLIDPQGESHAPVNMTPMPGVQGAQIHFQAAGGNGAVVQMNVVGGVAAAPVPGARANVVFQNLPDLEGKWALVVTLPRSRVAKEFAFKIEDVPLP